MNTAQDNTDKPAPQKPGPEQGALCNADHRPHLPPERSVRIKRTQIQHDGDPDNGEKEPGAGDQSSGPWVVSPRNRKRSRCLIPDQLGDAENVVLRVWERKKA